MTLSQAAAELGITSATLRQQIGKKAIVAEKLGSQWVLTDEEIERYRTESIGRIGRKKGAKNKPKPPE